MEKVIVNKTVAGWIEEAKKGCCETNVKSVDFSNMWGLIDKRYHEIKEQNIDIVTLAKAIQYGYEVPYEFKVGDLVYYNKFTHKQRYPIIIVPNNFQKNNDHEIHIDYVKLHYKDYTLICKAENREDLK